MRAVTHVHTCFSFDCRSTPERIVASALALRLDLLLVADHDSFGGSLAVRSIVERRGSRMLVPIAAEVTTDMGDMIAVFNGPPVPRIAELKIFDDLVRIVGGLGGLVWMPHPFDHHRHIEACARRADVVERFNARSSREHDRLSAELQSRLGKAGAFSSDAHAAFELSLVVCEYPDVDTPLAALRRSPRPLSLRKAAPADIILSQMVKGWKQRSPRAVLLNLLRWLKRKVAGARARSPFGCCWRRRRPYPGRGQP